MGVGFGHAGEFFEGDFDRVFMQDGHAVVGFLADDGGLVTQISEGERGELVILAFDFLQQQQVGLFALQKIGDVGFAGADRIDVPGGDFSQC